ncbi:transcription antitermination factor NusB [Xanthovirga aplysinae]|uniref:transcription antitermination factor NusB n=1 Tax=Xanthovirga aplysinae TaxID=2529853 RepID=UPI0012BBFEC0|nr:transcription antitermination factor NusB [Xanthovirga aplysinae]MTI33355.1 transcription antitermination factor NusB [Xanthovirga aplysinae]
MLNRRSLRIKAMQTVYAFEQCKQSDYHLAIESIKNSFAPDLNSLEVQDKELLEKKKQMAIGLFTECFKEEIIPAKEDTSEDIRKAVKEAISFYHQQVDKDLNYFKKFMVAEAENLSNNYLMLLLLLVELSDMVKAEDDEKKNSWARKINPTYSSELNFYRNRLINALRNSNELKLYATKRNLNWSDDREVVKEWYKEILKHDETYKAYKVSAETTFEQDKDIVLYLIKKVIFKHELFVSFLEEKDLSWAEDKAALRSMLTKTIKGIEEEQEESGEIELTKLSMNWEEDKEFFKDLFNFTIQNDQEYGKTIAELSRNWDMERLASLDRILLKMALTEMINFPSIPVKVTINEYIELSKMYSTPKSKHFVNGILDVVAEKLVAEGVIRKSGRGLIDNK